MKMEQKAEFVPVVITLETAQEVNAFCELMYQSDSDLSQGAAVLAASALELLRSVLHPFRKPSR